MNIDFIKPYLPNIMLLNFSQYIGYLVDGYYIEQHLIISIKTKMYSYLVLLFRTFATTFLTTFYSSSEYFNETLYDYSTPDVALSTIGLFILFKTYAIKNIPILQKIDNNSFGIYFVHILILNFLETMFPYQNQINIFYYVLLISFLTFIISYVLIECLSHVPKLKFLTK